MAGYEPISSTSIFKNHGPSVHHMKSKWETQNVNKQVNIVDKEVS